MWDTIKSKVLLMALRIAIPLVIALVAVGVWWIIDTVDTAPKIEELSGTWEGELDTGLSWKDIFKSFEFYDAEIEILRENGLADKKLTVIETASFTKDKKYAIDLNKEATDSFLKEHLERSFDVLYDNRGRLRIMYNTDFSNYTKDQFRSFYVTMYAYDSYELLLQGFAESIYDGQYTSEKGEYHIQDDLIITRAKAGMPEFSLKYRIESDVLYLTYSWDTEDPLVVAYKRIN